MIKLLWQKITEIQFTQRCYYNSQQRNCPTIKLTNCFTAPSGSARFNFCLKSEYKIHFSVKRSSNSKIQKPNTTDELYTFINAEKFILQTVAKKQTYSPSLSPDDVFAFGQCLQLLLLIPCMLPVNPGFCLLGILFDLLPRDTFPPLKSYKYINN